MTRFCKFSVFENILEGDDNVFKLLGTIATDFRSSIVAVFDSILTIVLSGKAG